MRNLAVGPCGRVRVRPTGDNEPSGDQYLGTLRGLWDVVNHPGPLVHDGVDLKQLAREHADRIVGEALAGRRAVLATKGGVDKPEPGRILVDGSRDALLRQIDGALVNLGVERIDLFQLHRVDLGRQL